MRRHLLVVGAILASGCASTPDRPIAEDNAAVSVDEMCAVAQCDYNVKVELKRDDGSIFSETYDALPVVQDIGVSVYAGSTVYFEADISDGHLTNFRRVKEVINPERTISSRLEQTDQGTMMLVTTNPFDKPLRIRMGLMPLTHDNLIRTSSCPVIAGGSSFEMWPDPVFQVFLGEMRLMEENEEATCVE